MEMMELMEPREKTCPLSGLYRPVCERCLVCEACHERPFTRPLVRDGSPVARSSAPGPSPHGRFRAIPRGAGRGG